MTNLTKLLAAMILAFGLLSTTHAASIDLSVDQFANYQSEAPATDETDGTTDGTDDDGKKKKKDGEAEEPECE